MRSLIALLLCFAAASSLIAAEPVRVTCFGDSITFGWELPKGRRGELSYPGRLQQLLGETHRVANFGFPGCCALREGASPIWRVLTNPNKGALGSKPDIVIILLGTNDAEDKSWKFKQHFTRDYTDIVALFQKLPSKPKIYLCTLPRIFPDGKYGNAERARVAAEEITPQIRKLAQTLGTGLIELDGIFKNQTRKEAYQDALHPNPASYQRIAETIFTALTGNQPDPTRYLR